MTTEERLEAIKAIKLNLDSTNMGNAPITDGDYIDFILEGYNQDDYSDE